MINSNQVAAGKRQKQQKQAASPDFFPSSHWYLSYEAAQLAPKAPNFHTHCLRSICQPQCFSISGHQGVRLKPRCFCSLGKAIKDSCWWLRSRASQVNFCSGLFLPDEDVLSEQINQCIIWPEYDITSPGLILLIILIMQTAEVKSQNT